MSVALILSALMSQSCRDTPIFTKNLSSPTSMGMYISNLVHGVLIGVELELVYIFFISRSLAEISWAKVQYADVGLQHRHKRSYRRIFHDVTSPRQLKIWSIMAKLQVITFIRGMK